MKKPCKNPNAKFNMATIKDSKSRKNHIKTKRNPRRVKWTRFYVKGGIK